MFFFDDNTFVLRQGDPIGERLAKIAREKNILLMMCDMCVLERNFTQGQPGRCDPYGRGRTEPAECVPVGMVEGVQVGCLPGFYADLAGNPPDRIISL